MIAVLEILGIMVTEVALMILEMECFKKIKTIKKRE